MNESSISCILSSQVLDRLQFREVLPISGSVASYSVDVLPVKSSRLIRLGLVDKRGKLLPTTSQLLAFLCFIGVDWQTLKKPYLLVATLRTCYTVTTSKIARSKD